MVAHSTFDIEDKYFGSSNILKAAIKKHGKENFSKEIIEYCIDNRSMYQREAEIVDVDFINRIVIVISVLFLSFFILIICSLFFFY